MRRIALVLLLLIPGCIESFAKPECPAPLGWAITGPYDDEGRASAFKSTGNYHRMLYHLQNPTNDSAYLGLSTKIAGTPGGGLSGAIFSDADDPVPPNGSVLGAATPNFAASDAGDDEGWEYQLGLTLRHDGCKGVGETSQEIPFATNAAGEQARPGLGVQVKTAGFWTNGTLFYTNMQRIHDDPRIAHAGWYEWEGADPLPVYIYNTTRTERPERYNASGFVTTIPGFNEALKSIFVGTSYVADLAPEEAYTRAGNEQHDLYGDEIVFYIEITDVVAIDCPYPQPVCEAPTAPPASHAATPPASPPGRPV